MQIFFFPNLFPTVDFGAAAMPPPVDIVKVAIEWPGANAQLIEMDQVCVFPKTNPWNSHCEAFFFCMKFDIWFYVDFFFCS